MNIPPPPAPIWQALVLVNREVGLATDVAGFSAHIAQDTD